MQGPRDAQPDLDSRRVQHADRPGPGWRQAGCLDEVLLEVNQRGPVQGPARMLVRQIDGPAAVPGGVQSPAGGEELFQGRRLGDPLADANAEPQPGARPWPVALAGVA